MSAIVLFALTIYFIVGSTEVIRAKHVLGPTYNLFRIFVFMRVILENPNSHKYVHGNESKTFITCLLRMKNSSLCLKVQQN